MAIVRESFAAGGTGSANTSTVVTAPSGIQAGDWLIVAVAFNGSPGTLTPPTGSWSAITSTSPPTNPRWVVYFATATGSEGATFTVGHVNNVYDSWIATRYSGVQAIPLSVETNSGGTPGTSVSMTGVTTQADGAMVVAILVSNSSAQRIAETNALTQVAENSGASVKNMEYDDAIQASAGATGSITFTLNTSLDWGGVVLFMVPRVDAAVASGTGTANNATVSTSVEGAGVSALLLGGL